MMGLMMLFWLLVAAAVILLAFRASSGRWWGKGSSSAGESAEDIVRARYARGEIDRETYQRMLDDLRRGPGIAP